MADVTGYSPLDFVGFTDKGDYSVENTYMINDLVHYQNSIWRCKKDNTKGITPGENNNWTIFVNGTKDLNAIIAADVQGILGKAGATGVNAQFLINAIAEKVATKLLLKTDVVSQIVNDATKAASMAALYAVNQKIGDVANLPNSAADVVTAITQQNSNLTKKVNSDDIALTDVKSKFTGSTNCIVEKAFKQGNIIQLYVTIKNISSGWTEFSLTTTYSIVSTAPGKIHKASSPDSTTELTCSFNGAKVIVLSANAVANGVSVQFDLMIR